ncbi:MAG: AEC family transporter [Oceanospirillaceae bacterium]|nr:AEC family transporter [Oceanospirillaceae bacterium]
MLAILAITTPIFLLIALGYLLVRVKLVPQGAIDGMGNFVVYLALPALLFKALSSRPVSDVYNSHYLQVFALGSVLSLLISVWWAKKIRGVGLERAAFLGLGSALSNNGFIGYALVTQLFGSVAVAAAALSMLVDLIVLIPLTIVLAEWAGNGTGHVRHAIQTAFLKTLRNPLVIAIGLGFLASAAQWQPVAPVMRAIDMLASSAAPLSLFVIGGMLVGISMKGQRIDLCQMTVFKLALHPCLVALCVWLLPAFDPMLQLCAVLLAAVPMAGVFPLIAQTYGQQQVCAAALVTATIISFFTLNVVLWLMDQFGGLSTVLV